MTAIERERRLIVGACIHDKWLWCRQRQKMYQQVARQSPTKLRRRYDERIYAKVRLAGEFSDSSQLPTRQDAMKFGVAALDVGYRAAQWWEVGDIEQGRLDRIGVLEQLPERGGDTIVTGVESQDRGHGGSGIQRDVMLYDRKRIIEMMEQLFPFLIAVRLPEADRVILKRLPVDE